MFARDLRHAVRSPFSARTVPVGVALVFLASAPAFATHHLMVIQEVFAGRPGDMVDPNIAPDQRAQYVMLRMTNAGENLVSGSVLRVEDRDGNILGNFGQFAANVSVGTVGCVYPNCPAILMGTQAANGLFTFAFDAIVDGQIRVGLPLQGGRVCFHDGGAGTLVFDCVAWGNFSCSAANCPAGPNTLHVGDTNSGTRANLCDTNWGTPAAPGGLQYGKSLVRSTFNCGAKENSTDFSLAFPKPVDNAGANDNTDADGDGLIDALDCNDANAALQWSPVEIQNLRVAGSAPSTESWDSQAAFAGAGVKYDEIRGTLSLVNGFVDDACHAPGLTATSASDTDLPATSSGFYYLVRANGGVGCVGTYGSSSAAVSRDPSVSACP